MRPPPISARSPNTTLSRSLRGAIARRNDSLQTLEQRLEVDVPNPRDVLAVGNRIVQRDHRDPRRLAEGRGDRRSEEHTSELQSLAYLVCRLLLEKKKKERY